VGLAVELSIDIDPQEETLTLASPEYMIIVNAAPADLARLSSVEASPDGLTVGTCLGSNVHWTPGPTPQTVTVLIGPDPETWFVSLTLGLELVREIAADAAAAASDEAPQWGRRRPAMPPSTARIVPVVDADRGPAR
jgi:hypothetical protein